MIVNVESPSTLVVRDAILAAARAGEPCPTNEDLAERAGYRSATGPAMAIDALVRAGVLIRRGVGKRRQFECAETGVVTGARMFANHAPKGWQPEPALIAARDAFAAAMGAEASAVEGPSRAGPVARARRLVAYGLHRHFPALSFSQIGFLLGHRCRETVYHYLRDRTRLDADGELRAVLAKAIADAPRAAEQALLPTPRKPVRGRVGRKPAELGPLPQLRPGRWCAQCDALVGGERAARCASLWCSLRAKA